MNFSRKSTGRKQRALRSTSTKAYSKIKFWTLRLFVVAVIGSIVAAGYGSVGLFKGILDSSPALDTNNIQPEYFASTLYDSKKKETFKLVGSDANRISVSLSQMPDNLKNAFIAIEDERFYSHNGIDMKGILRAGMITLSNGSLGQGASTITQQLLKNVVFSGGNETTYAEKIERKVQEQFLAIKLEKTVSKDVILENYLNTINLGQNTLGVQAASLRYFDKDVSKLTLSECAVIAGITKNPSSLNPISYPDNNADRRKSVLSKMLELSMITQEEYEEALADDVYTRIQEINAEKTKTVNTVTSYFTDAVIDSVLEDLQTKLGYTQTQASNLLYRGGLSIYTTQDSAIQKICDNVISNNAYYPIGTRYSLYYRLTVTDRNGDVHNYDENSLRSYFRSKGGSFELLFTDKKKAKNYVKKYRKYILKETNGTVDGEVVSFSIEPQVSFVIMDQSTGKVKALVGGRGTKNASRTLNRATTSKRQPGSTFKVLSAYLPAIDGSGMTLATVHDDAPFNYPGTRRPVRNWYSSGYRGLTTIRNAIKDSMNIVTVKTLEEVTPKESMKYLKKLGFTTLVTDTSKPANDVNLSTALGGLTYGVTNFEATAAYAAIANKGKYQKPILYTKIVDHDGNVLIDNSPKAKKVMKESTAYLLTNAMQDVVTSGTGTLARFTSSAMPVAGKTGTTSDNVDAWFIGYTPYYTAGIWTGYDNNESLSNTSYHKVIWRTIMEKVHAKKGKKVMNFSKPDSIVTARVCTKSGKLAKSGLCDSASGGSTVKTEYFAGSAPSEYCDAHVSVQVCSASGKLATGKCPKNCVHTKVLLVKDETGNTADTPYVISRDKLKSKCDVHTGQSSSKDDVDKNLPNTDVFIPSNEESSEEQKEELTPEG